MRTTTTMARAMRTTRASSRAALGLVAIIAIALGACATGRGPDPLLATGQAIKAAGTEFLEAGQLYDALYRARRMPESEYDKWRRFEPEFRKAEQAAFQTWKTALSTKDQASADRAKAIVDALRRQVLEFLLGVTTTPAARTPAAPGR